MIRQCILASLGVLIFDVFPALSLAQNDPFTVADSIQMVHFNDPDGRAYNPPAWNISPNGSTVLVVTTRGIVASNVVESTLWTLDLRLTAKHLKNNEGILPSSLSKVFTVRGQLRASQSNSYGSLITNCRWSLDSKAIYMLVEQRGGRRELDEISSITKRNRSLSKKGYSLTKYEVDRGGISYFANQVRDTSEREGANTLGVVDTVRGTSFMNLLDPLPLFPKTFLFRSDSTGIRLLSPAALDSRYDTSFISPDKSKIITLVPVEQTPDAWKQYLPGLPDRPLYRSEASQSPVLEWELDDLNSHSRQALLGTPSGAMSGYADETAVAWSPGGDHVLLTNTFLPFNHQTQKEQESRRRPCAVAYVDIGERSATCIVFSRSAGEGEATDSWATSAVSFGRTDHDVVVNLEWRGRSRIECYSSNDGVWSQKKGDCDTQTHNPDQAHRAPVRLELKQSLDEPPTLWAEGLESSRSIQIFNPNPQIAGKVSGTTSVYHWLDKDKREWSGELILPSGSKPGVRYPLVIQTHGFSPKEFLVDGAWTTANAARPLAASGFAVLQIEDNHEQTESLEEAKIHVNGYAAAIDKLAESGLIDPKRVGIIGFSRTCWFVEESLLESPDRFAAAVIADGVDQSYFQYMLVAPEWPALESQRYNGGKPIGKGLDSWIKSAPDFRLSELRTPLRLQAITPASLLGEWEIYASLRIQHKPVDLLYLPLGQHVLQNPAELMASEQGDVDWFRYWLKGEEDRGSEKKTQYERWDKLQAEWVK
jgi:dipeptidyl aminopeptidase/acylaminoacyl peptidase